MKKFLSSISILSLLITSCSPDEENPSPETEFPVISEITTTEITDSSASLSWTASISNGSDLSFDIFLENNKVAESITDFNWTFEGLEELTSYSGRIIALSKSGNTREKSFSFTTVENPVPPAIEISITEIATKSALVTWTTTGVEGNSEIVYDLYLNGTLKEEDLNTNSLALEDLTPFKQYTIEIIANSNMGKTFNAKNTFQTLGTPPSSFPLSIDNGDDWDDLDPHWLIINWTPPTVEDGSPLSSYEVYLNDVLIMNFLNRADDDFLFSFLDEGTTYTVKVVAKAVNKTQTEEKITFTTITHPELTDFEAEVTSITSSSAKISWTSSTDPEGGRVHYFINLDGVRYPGSHTFTYSTSYEFDNLTPNTTYTVKVIAEKSEGHPQKILEKEINFTTDYIAHPTLQVEKAVLYTPNSQFFGGQLNVMFTESIEGMEIQEFNAGGVAIENFIINSSSISSSVLSTTDYATINSEKKGYVLVKDNEITYKLDFDIVEESN